MAFGYYQQNGQQGWGTNQFQFGAPPTPAFHPQPSWGGTDFFRAHAGTADPYLFDHAWNRVREYGGAPAGGMGVGLHEARHWHKRAYGIQNEVDFLAPNELGHAAAYEAYRTWIHNSFMYEPLSGDIERQREALTGLAVGEAARLLQFSSRPLDHYARLAATEAAAHTASYIFYQTRDGEYRSRSRHRRGSIDDPYAYDDDLLYPRSHSRPGSRHRSHSRHRSYSQSGMMPFPGQSYSASSMISPSAYAGNYGSYPGSHSAMPMAIHSSAYHSNTMPMGSGSVYGSPMSMGVSPTGYNTGIPPGIASSYQGSNLGVSMGYPRSRSSSFSYAQHTPYPQQAPFLQPAPYMGTAMSATPYMGTAMSGMGGGGQTIVIHKPKKSKHHSKRSRSSDGDYHRHSSSDRY